ncbi:hypothetical protein N8727_02610 [Candidatus Pelagibacter sp.]|nr:hypothetical protein [Candidatus Pelagibacter sp.]
MKRNKRLVITDLIKDNDILIKDCDFIALNYGQIRQKNVINLNIKDFYRKFLTSGKKKYHTTLKKYLSKKKLFPIHPVELEISNCRNEKYDYIHKIINILILKEVIKNYQQVEIIFDDSLYYNSYKSLSKKIKINFKGVKKSYSYVLNFLISRFYFFLKTFLFILFTKIFKENKTTDSCKEVNLTFYPMFFKNKQDYMYRNNKMNLNFLISDETHLYLGFRGLYKRFFEVKNQKDMIIVEKYIEIKDIIKNFFFTFKIVKNLYSNNSFKIDNIVFNDVILKYFYKSLLNTSKLTIYTNALLKIASKLKIKKINYIMFEYGFGYFLRKTLLKRVLFYGYQHGYYSDKIMWLNQVNLYKNKKTFLPNKVICKNKVSFISYKKIFPNYDIKIDKKNEVINKFFTEINNSIKDKNNKFLIICGAYDFNEILNSIKIISLKPTYNKIRFYLKIHPKMVLNGNLAEYRNIKILRKLNQNKFEKVIITSASTMTTEAEAYLKNYSIISLPHKHDIIPTNFPKKKIYNFY